MESSLATETDTLPTLELLADAGPETVGAGGRRKSLERSSVLARALAASDLASAIATGFVIGLATGMDSGQALALGASAGLAFPVTMFALGIYSVDELRGWASGVSEAPKALVGALAFGKSVV